MSLDRVLEPFAALVRRLTSRIDYLALYSARVVSQGLDGSLEVVPDDDRLPSLSAVPIRYGLPGVAAIVSDGARVLVGFENGDPQRPVALLWDAATAELAFNGGTQPVAREGDQVQVTIPIGVVLVASPAGPVPNPAPITITGSITAGAPKVKA